MRLLATRLLATLSATAALAARRAARRGAGLSGAEIRSICNFAPGSGSDIIVRFYSDKLAKLTGRPVVVENRPGANGAIATGEPRAFQAGRLHSS